jgi:hypothetical protein
MQSSTPTPLLLTETQIISVLYQILTTLSHLYATWPTRSSVDGKRVPMLQCGSDLNASKLALDKLGHIRIRMTPRLLHTKRGPTVGLSPYWKVCGISINKFPPPPIITSFLSLLML